ncbi:hypothetical protein [Rathayibacter sp. AY2B9]|uniref:hypothetical protein n=1 Tax=Rathayibacter sp. AY2B9 TaxID=2080572 RepID=UPI000CE7A663|nr:hypothetical protein [Rathayibacter sp. AY2B9]PPG34497.1 hypothetical protein C5C25_00300 [Rathayibacter sp. AY2B9]
MVSDWLPRDPDIDRLLEEAERDDPGMFERWLMAHPDPVPLTSFNRVAFICAVCGDWTDTENMHNHFSGSKPLA